MSQLTRLQTAHRIQTDAAQLWQDRMDYNVLTGKKGKDYAVRKHAVAKSNLEVVERRLLKLEGPLWRRNMPSSNTQQQSASITKA